MSQDPVEFPQNVYIEDRIVGPLTLRQIIVMTLGGGFSYIVFSIVQKSVGTMNIAATILCWLPFLVCVAFALIRINDLSLLRIVFLIMERSYKSSVRTFAPRQGISINIRFSAPGKSELEEQKEKERQKKLEEARSQTKIAELSRIIDQPLNTIGETPVADAPLPQPEAAAPAETAAQDEDDKPLSLPVNPSRVAVDGRKAGGALNAPPLSDLSVFRDIVSPASLMAFLKPKNTVRQRKKTAITSTQRYLPIGEIRQDTVLLKNGGMRAVLEVEALNFNLKSETEQQGIISGYESFVNTISFPVQIVIRSARINIDPYLLQLRDIADRQTNELLKRQTQSYADFIDRLVEVADIMQKKFYVVVPLDASTRNKTLVEKFLGWLSIDDTTSRALERGRQFASLSHELKDRVMLVTSGLENIGLHCTRLETQKLIELYYSIYNPKTSQEQKLPKEEGAMKVDKTTL